MPAARLAVAPAPGPPPSQIDALEAALAAATTPAERVRAQDALATELARTGHAKRAITIAKEARASAQGIGDSELIAGALHTLARCHFYLADFVSSLELLLEAARTYRERGDTAGAATALAGVGLCQHRLGAQEDAIASLLGALESAREQGLAALEIDIHNSLGSVFLASGRVRRRGPPPRGRGRARDRAGQQEPPHEARAQPDVPRAETAATRRRSARRRSGNTRPGSSCRNRRSRSRASSATVTTKHIRSGSPARCSGSWVATTRLARR